MNTDFSPQYGPLNPKSPLIRTKINGYTFSLYKLTHNPDDGHPQSGHIYAKTWNELDHFSARSNINEEFLNFVVSLFLLILG